jgi:voltage-gated potassium channel
MRRRLTFAFGVLAAVLLGGTLGYMFIEGWTWYDSLYMTVITVGTIGYEEVAPLSPVGRAFNMAVIFAGFGTMFLVVGTTVDFIFEGHWRQFVEGRRMNRRIDSLDRHHIVAGMGRVGSVVARQLADEGAPFIIIDKDKDVIELADEKDWIVLAADATDQDSLVQAGVERARSLVSTLDTDADNLFVTFTARSLNPDLFIVARSTHESNEDRLRQAGANRVITPNAVSGRRMATMVLHPVVSDFLDLVTHGEEVEFRLQEVVLGPQSQFAGKTIGESRVRDVTGAYVLAIQSPEGHVSTSPPADAMMNAHDKLVVLGTAEQLEALERTV